jgi:hypothetical protein
MDFNAASFEDCAFEGKLTDVWFRGGFRYPVEEHRYGPAKKNRMEHVSFAKAQLEDLTFSDSCDLSTIILPETGGYRRYDRWLERLLALQTKARNWSCPDDEEAAFFVKVYINHARNQDWMILSVKELRMHYCPNAADRVIETLDRS